MERKKSSVCTSQPTLEKKEIPRQTCILSIFLSPIEGTERLRYQSGTMTHRFRNNKVDLSKTYPELCTVNVKVDKSTQHEEHCTHLDCTRAGEILYQHRKPK